MNDCSHESMGIIYVVRGGEWGLVLCLDCTAWTYTNETRKDFPRSGAGRETFPELIGGPRLTKYPQDYVGAAKQYVELSAQKS